MEVYESEPDIKDKIEPRILDSIGIKGKIQTENATFAFQHPDSELDPPALKNTNLSIQPDQSNVFLFTIGVGKSALINLIPGF